MSVVRRKRLHIEISMKTQICCFILVALSFSACATVAGLKPGKGLFFTACNHSYDEVWNASTKSIRQRPGVNIAQFDKEKGFIKASRSLTLTSWGGVVGVFITPLEQQDCHKIEVVERKRLLGQLSGPNWEPDILLGIQAELGD